MVMLVYKNSVINLNLSFKSCNFTISSCILLIFGILNLMVMLVYKNSLINLIK